MAKKLISFKRITIFFLGMALFYLSIVLLTHKFEGIINWGPVLSIFMSILLAFLVGVKQEKERERWESLPDEERREIEEKKKREKEEEMEEYRRRGGPIYAIKIVIITIILTTIGLYIGVYIIDLLLKSG